jgi:hypothetical protein
MRANTRGNQLEVRFKTFLEKENGLMRSRACNLGHFEAKNYVVRSPWQANSLNNNSKLILGV